MGKDPKQLELEFQFPEKEIKGSFSGRFSERERIKWFAGDNSSPWLFLDTNGDNSWPWLFLDTNTASTSAPDFMRGAWRVR